jgi:chemotaxis protein MotB
VIAAHDLFILAYLRFMRSIYHLFLAAAICGAGCVSTGKFNTMQRQAQLNDSLRQAAEAKLKTCLDANTGLYKQKSLLQDTVNDLNLQLNVTKDNNDLLKKQLSNLSTLSTTQAESIKRSLDNIGAKDAYFQALHTALASRDSASLAVLLNLKQALGGFADQGVTIRADQGMIDVELADKLLFATDSNSITITDKAKPVLARLARALNDLPGIEFTVEGHTDSIAYPLGVLVDNWDLSVKRATAVVRILQNDYHVSPSRMTAAGRGEFITVAGNDTPEGRAANRRTRIIILPQMGPLLKLIQQGQDQPPAVGTGGS